MNTNDQEATENKNAHLITAGPLKRRSSSLTPAEIVSTMLKSKRVFQIPVAPADMYIWNF